MATHRYKQYANGYVTVTCDRFVVNEPYGDMMGDRYVADTEPMGNE